MLKTWQVVLATVGIFIAGLVTGGAITLRVGSFVTARRGFDQEGFRNQTGGGGPGAQAGQGFGGAGNGIGGQRPNPEQPFGVQLIRRFANQLDLTPAQRRKIQPIVRTTGEELGRLSREAKLKAALALESMQDQIAAQLNPAQRARFEALLSQQRARLQEVINERNQQRLNPNAQPQVEATPKPK